MENASEGQMDCLSIMKQTLGLKLNRQPSFTSVKNNNDKHSANDDHSMSSVKANSIDKLELSEPPSPHKRRKLDPRKPKNDIYHKSYIPGRYTKVDNLHRLRRSADQKEDELSGANTTIMTLKTKKHNLEFERYKLDDEYMKLKQELTMTNDQIDELQYHEKQSLKDLEAKLELSTKEMKLQHDSLLQKEKELASKEIERLIGDIQRNYINQKEALVKDCEQLESKISRHDNDTNECLLEVRQNHNKKLCDLEKTIDETLDQLSKDLVQLERDQVEKQQLIDDTHNRYLLPLTREKEQLTASLESLKKKFNGKELEITTLSNKASSLTSKITSTESSITNRTNEINQKLEAIMTMKEDLLNLELERRYLHNKLQELKGNIRVFCRIRPPNDPVSDLASIEYPSDDNDIDEIMSSQKITIAKDADLTSSLLQQLQGPSQRNKNSYAFAFDKVFNPNHKNIDIFLEISQLVQSVLDGYNVCVFAYGQTGSGKTWTMSHPQDGMIPLTINKIFNDIEDLKQSGWEYLVEGQFLEIYNETILDLLNHKPLNDIKYEIKHDDSCNKTSISNMSSVKLASAKQAISTFNKSSGNRSTASTKSNERSSRSHSIFILETKGYNHKTGKSCQGCLNLVDLAGSERLNSSQAKGDRLKETQHINKSLSCLGDVIYSLGQASKSSNSNHHIPYRNSKLTYLLKNSLGGDSKTLMFVNISPYLDNFGESLNSFRFATKVSNTKQRIIKK